MIRELVNFLFPTSGYRRGTVSNLTVEKIKRDWENIDILMKGKNPSQLKQALITADKTLDAALKDIVAGETMGERLKNAKDKFERSTYNRIWDAHKLRNSLVHEAGFEPGYYTLDGAVTNLRYALRTLKIYV